MEQGLSWSVRGLTVLVTGAASWMCLPPARYITGATIRSLAG